MSFERSSFPLEGGRAGDGGGAVGALDRQMIEKVTP